MFLCLISGQPNHLSMMWFLHLETQCDSNKNNLIHAFLESDKDILLDGALLATSSSEQSA